MVDGMLAPIHDAAVRDPIRVSMLATPEHVAISAMKSMADPAVYSREPIKVPLLAVLAKSPFWAADTDQFFRSIAPDFESQWWEGVSHFLMMEKPKQFNDAVIAG